MAKYLELFIESINFILINYALSNMSMLFRNNPIFILFFASEIWLMGKYLEKAKQLTQNKIVSTVLLILCFLIHIGLIYFIGRVVGEIIPFN